MVLKHGVGLITKQQMTTVQVTDCIGMGGMFYMAFTLPLAVRPVIIFAALQPGVGCLAMVAEAVKSRSYSPD